MRVDALFERTRPHYAMLLWLWLIPVCTFQLHLPGPVVAPPTHATLSVLSWLPDALRLSHTLRMALGAAFVLLALLALLQVLLPWSALGATLPSTAASALWEEQARAVDHMFHLPVMTLWVLTVWMLACRRDIADAVARGRFWLELTLPRWVPLLLATHVAWFYLLAGVAKLQDSGLHWANGTSMQLWMVLWAKPGPVLQLALSSKGFAQALQAGALFAELSAPLLLLHPTTRMLSGLLLLSFHLGQHLIFGWWFTGNMVVLAFAFLPMAEVLERRTRSFAPDPAARSTLPRALLSRLDFKGRHAR